MSRTRLAPLLVGMAGALLCAGLLLHAVAGPPSRLGRVFHETPGARGELEPTGTVVAGGDVDCTEPQTDLCQGKCTVGGNNCVTDLVCIVPPVDTLFWQEPAQIGGTGVVYDTLRSTVSTDFTTPATCVETDELNRVTSDSTTPAPGGILYYLVRIENECPLGNMAADSEGDPRTGLVCE